MSQEEFLKFMPFIWGVEGGFSDDPADYGGATNFGITLNEWNAYKRSKRQPETSYADFRDKLRKVDTIPVYWENYWLASGCGMFEFPVMQVLMDAAVNEGVGKSREYRANTTQFANTPNIRATRILILRKQHYEYIVSKDKTQSKFLKGWLNRLNDLEAWIKAHTITGADNRGS